MNIYIYIIIFLLGAVTFLGFDKLIKPNENVGNTVEEVDGKQNYKDLEKEPSLVSDEAVAVPKVPTPIQRNSIDLSNKGLTKAPEYIFNEKNTEVLDLSNNKINGSLQAEVRQLVSLRILDLSNNDFTGVPAEIGQLKNLEILDLSNNPISGLPYEIANLKKLKTLDLRNTNYSELDMEVIRKGLPPSVSIYTN